MAKKEANEKHRTTSDVAKAVGLRVRAARQTLELSQEALGARAKLSRVTISEIENGHRTRLTPTVLQSIANATGRSEAYFYGTESPVQSLDHVIQQTNLSEHLGMLLPKLQALPHEQQARLGVIIEQLLGWQESIPSR